MADRYKNKYRTTSHRKPNWDYSSAGAYFITICTQNRECNLGEIVKNKDDAFLQLSDFGKIVAAEWHKSFEIRKEFPMPMGMPYRRTAVRLCGNPMNCGNPINPHPYHIDCQNPFHHLWQDSNLR